MSMPPNLKAKYLARFDELIDEGVRILTGTHSHSDNEAKLLRESAGVFQFPGIRHHEIEPSAGMEFQNKAKTLIANVLPSSHPDRFRLANGPTFLPHKEGVAICHSFLRSTKNDFQYGFLDSISSQVEAEISADYLGQAEQLLKEGSSGQHEYVPAAVLAGAVLERGLKTLCENQTPPILTVKPNGEPMTMNPLIDELKKAGVFNELRAKDLRAWADIRNAAAHGEFQKFKREQVERMLAGVSSFLAEMH